MSDKHDNLDDFLAAPESTLQSETERRKAAQRKAKLEAEEKRLEAEKSNEIPSDEDLFNDILRVATDSETNPWAKWRVVSRKRYELFGWYPIKYIEMRFGQFEHAKQIAGLADKPGTRIKKGARAEASRREHAARYVRRIIWPYVRKNPELSRELVGAKMVLSLSDNHGTFLDPFTWQAFLAAIKILKPDVVYLNGDMLEAMEISRHPKIPGWTVPLQLEFDFVREMFTQIRRAGHNGDLIWGGGNHGIDRLAMYLTQVAKELAGLRTLRFDVLAGLNDLDVQLAQGGTIASPYGTENDKRGMLLYGFYRIHHGTLLGQNPAGSELKAAGRSGQSGHAHRAGLAFGTTEASDALCWMTTPCACTEHAARAYIKGVNTGWQKGFGIAFLFPDQTVHQYPVITDGGRATFEGYTFEADPGIKDPDPSTLWLKDLPELEV